MVYCPEYRFQLLTIRMLRTLHIHSIFSIMTGTLYIGTNNNKTLKCYCIFKSIIVRKNIFVKPRTKAVIEVKRFLLAMHNCRIQLLKPQYENMCGQFFIHLFHHQLITVEAQRIIFLMVSAVFSNHTSLSTDLISSRSSVSVKRYSVTDEKFGKLNYTTSK